MKKIISALLVLAMACSIFCVSAAADEGVTYLHTDFSNEEYYYQNFMEGAFFIEGGILCGYNEAKSLQSWYDSGDDGFFLPGATNWLTYDTTATFTIGVDDVVAEDAGRSITLAYCNDNRKALGLVESREFINFTYDVVNQQFSLTNGTIGNLTDETMFLADPVPMEIACDGTQSITMGMSVEQGRIRCFLDGNLIYDFSDPEYHIAESKTSIFIMWNENNFMQYTDITVMSQGSIFPNDAPVTDGTTADDNSTDSTDVPVDGTTESPVADGTTADDNVTVTGEPAEDTTRVDTVIVTNEEGETEVQTEIVTDPPAADTVGTTGTTRPSTSTGDAAFVVAIAMVAALGSAIIVKKVRG